MRVLALAPNRVPNRKKHVQGNPDTAQNDSTPPEFTIIVTAEVTSSRVRATIARLRALDYNKNRIKVLVSFHVPASESGLVEAAVIPDGISNTRGVTVVHGVHGSRVDARNAALSHVDSGWVTFLDDGDSLSRGALRRVAVSLRKRPDSDYVLLRRQSKLRDGTPVGLQDPLNARLTHNHSVSLDARPQFFPYAVTGTFIRGDVVNAKGLNFDSRINSIIEETHFLCRYVGSRENARVSIAASERYIENIATDEGTRHRRDVVDAARYTTSWEWGIRDIVESCKAGDRLPTWTQNAILYELHWLFRTEVRTGLGTVARGNVADEFRTHLLSVIPYLEPYVIDGYGVTLFSRAWRDTLLHGLSDEDWHTDHVVVTKIDRKRRMFRVSYRFAGREPEFVWESRGTNSEPAATKLQALSYFGFGPLYERHYWLTYGTSGAFYLNGKGIQLSRVWEPTRKYTLTSNEIQKLIGVSVKRQTPRKRRRSKPLFARLKHEFPIYISRIPLVRRKLQNAWVLMDREDQGEDSGEVLFRHLRRSHHEINAWFVVKRDTSTWKRLRAEGYRRVIAYGSLPWKVLMLKAEFLVSVQASPAITAPAELKKYRMNWRFVFLQHGVIKDDISRWLNNKPISMMLTSSPAEHKSIVGEGSRYVYSDWEIKLTGLPRFDALTQAESKASESAKRSAILIAPTWRKWLDDLVAHDETAFAGTDYAREWLSFVTSPALVEAARRRGLKIAILPHPNLRRALLSLDLPDEIEFWDFEDGRAQQNFVEAAVLVTDYSSMAFNAAYLERPVVYFQFDRDRHDAGDHTALPGYFDYDRDGFGARTDDVESAVDATVAALDGAEGSEEYAERRAAAFAYRDGQSSERVVQEILNLRRAWTPATATPRAVADQSPGSIDQ